MKIKADDWVQLVLWCLLGTYVLIKLYHYAHPTA